jgi:hypothetical protein
MLMEKPEGLKCADAHDPNRPKTPPPSERLSSPAAPPSTGSERWREVAAQAASETDPQRLSQLVDELIRLLDEGRRHRPDASKRERDS